MIRRLAGRATPGVNDLPTFDEKARRRTQRRQFHRHPRQLIDLATMPTDEVRMRATLGNTLITDWLPGIIHSHQTALTGQSANLPIDRAQPEIGAKEFRRLMQFKRRQGSVRPFQSATDGCPLPGTAEEAGSLDRLSRWQPGGTVRL